jgi:putative phosphoribosyl transferase
MRFQDRSEAGKRLASALEKYRDSDALVLALPRGGVVIGFEVSSALALPMDVAITRKIGAPGNPEYALGAISESGDVQLNETELTYFRIPASYIQEEIDRQRREIERRRQMYRGGAEALPLGGRQVIIVDDGIATGFTIFATVRAAQKQSPEKIIVAVPVAPPSTVRALEREVDEVVALDTPEPFMAVGAWYENFDQVSDDEVEYFLARARSEGRAKQEGE